MPIISCTLVLMNTLPLQFLVMTLAGWVSRNQQDVIEYLLEENRVASPASPDTLVGRGNGDRSGGSGGGQRKED